MTSDPFPSQSSSICQIFSQSQIISAQSCLEYLSAQQAHGAMNIFITLQKVIKNHLKQGLQAMIFRKCQQNRKKSSLENINYLDLSQSSIKSLKNNKSKMDIVHQKKQLLEDTLKKLLHGKQYKNDRIILHQLEDKILHLENMLKNMAEDMSILEESQQSIMNQNLLEAQRFIDKTILEYRTLQSIQNVGKYNNVGTTFKSPPKCLNSGDMRQKINIYYNNPPAAIFYPHYYAEKQLNPPKCSQRQIKISSEQNSNNTIFTLAQRTNYQHLQNQPPKSFPNQSIQTFNNHKRSAVTQNSENPKKQTRRRINILSPPPYHRKNHKQ